MRHFRASEFWNASTRPLDKNGFGLSVSETDRLARVIERISNCCRMVDVYGRWGALLVAHNIQGVQVHYAGATGLADRPNADHRMRLGRAAQKKPTSKTGRTLLTR